MSNLLNKLPHRSVSRLAYALSALLVLSACQANVNVTQPRPSASASPTASPTPSANPGPESPPATSSPTPGLSPSPGPSGQPGSSCTPIGEYRGYYYSVQSADQSTSKDFSIKCSYTPTVHTAITVKVTAVDDMPLANAEVTLISQNNSDPGELKATTSAEGIFTLPALQQAGKYTLSIKLSGYKTLTENLDYRLISQGASTEGALSLPLTRKLTKE